MVRLINSTSVLHSRSLAFWQNESQNEKAKSRVIPSRFELFRAGLALKTLSTGDDLCRRMKQIFIDGFGLVWSDNQNKIFEAFQNSCLSLIYGAEWNEQKTRVLKQRNLKREMHYTLVNMARRNGKTFSVSGSAAALALAIPGAKIAIFSTCKRTSQMMLQAVCDMLDMAFKTGTVVQEKDFRILSKNSEMICFMGPDGTRRTIGSYPGSVRVSEGAREREPRRFIGSRNWQSTANEPRLATRARQW